MIIDGVEKKTKKMVFTLYIITTLNSTSTNSYYLWVMTTAKPYFKSVMCIILFNTKKKIPQKILR